MQIKINRIILLAVLLLIPLFAEKVLGQGLEPDKRDVELEGKAAADSSVAAILDSADSTLISSLEIKPFKPNPTKAVLFSAIFPGLGQIYNRKYWKLPIVYGAFVGCTYAITWNNKNLKDYSQAYGDILGPDPEKNNSWENFLPVGANPSDYINNTNFQETLKRRKDFYRRYRDLSIIIAVGVYVLCMVDSYVDAQLFNFDISPDLSMRVMPSMEMATPYSAQTYGLNCSLKF